MRACILSIDWNRNSTASAATSSTTHAYPTAPGMLQCSVRAAANAPARKVHDALIRVRFECVRYDYYLISATACARLRLCKSVFNVHIYIYVCVGMYRRCSQVINSSDGEATNAQINTMLPSMREFAHATKTRRVSIQAATEKHAYTKCNTHAHTPSRAAIEEDDTTKKKTHAAWAHTKAHAIITVIHCNFIRFPVWHISVSFTPVGSLAFAVAQILFARADMRLFGVERRVIFCSHTCAA